MYKSGLVPRGMALLGSSAARSADPTYWADDGEDSGHSHEPLRPGVALFQVGDGRRGLGEPVAPPSAPTSTETWAVAPMEAADSCRI
jgi:hypothetical protein